MWINISLLTRATERVNRFPRSIIRAASTCLYLLECARCGVSSLWVVVKDCPKSLSVCLAVVMLSSLSRRVERHRTRWAVHVTAHWLQTSGRKLRRRDVTARWWWRWRWRHITSGRCRLTTHTSCLQVACNLTEIIWHWKLFYLNVFYSLKLTTALP